MKSYPFSNTTGGTIPAGAALVPAGIDANGLMLVGQPTADSSMFVVFNGPADVPAGATGVAFDWTAGDVPVGVNAADAPYTTANTFGTKAGDWLLRKGKTGFRVVTDTIQGIANAMPDPLGAAGAGSVWSTTDAGILTTGDQTGLGIKTSTAWDSQGSFTSTGNYWPYIATATATDYGGISASLYTQAFVQPYAPPAITTLIQWALIANHAGTKGATVLNLFQVTPSTLAPVNHVIAAGDVQVSPSVYLHGFAVFRVTNIITGVTSLLVGIDRDFASGDRPIVRGGIIVGYIDSGGTSHYP